MAYREVRMVEVREVLRLWLRGEGLRSVAGWVSLDRKTVRGYVEAGRQAGLDRDRGEEQLSDELLAEVVDTVRPRRPCGRGPAWQQCEAHRDQLAEWLRQDLTVVKCHQLLARQGAAGVAAHAVSVLHRGVGVSPGVGHGGGGRRRAGP
jgi:hypothetical protein